MLIVTTFAAFLTPFLTSAVNLALPSIGRDLHASAISLGWRSIFGFMVPIGIVSLVLINRKIKTEWAESSGEKFDWRGSVIYGMALASLARNKKLGNRAETL